MNALVHPERYLKSISNTASRSSTASSALTETPKARSKGKGKVGRAASSPVKASSNQVREEEAEEDFVTDTSLLFRGYQAGGRMLNVYDWYAAFKEALDGRRRAARKPARGQNPTNGKGKGKQKAEDSDSDAEDEVVEAHLRSPSKRGRPRGRGRGRGRGGRGSAGVGVSGSGRGNTNGSGSGHAVGAASGADADASNHPDRNEDSTNPDEGHEREHDHNGEEAVADGTNHDDDSSSDSEDGKSLEGEERENWEAEVQVRFMRGVHELDVLGFVKHTGRRGEHVVKTVFEPLEEV